MAYKKLKYWFDGELAVNLAEKIGHRYPGFDTEKFVQRISAGVGGLELKDRVELMADALAENMFPEYTHSLKILIDILGPENPLETGIFTEGYWVMPIAKYVEKYGIDDFEISMRGIEEITKRNTGEYAIRPFLVRYPSKTDQQMAAWSRNANFHVRRLASEGMRPRLPWAAKLDRLIADPAPILPVLENLKDDPSRYVQKSVANNLHDILKDNREIAMKVVRSWSVGATKPRRWIIRHSLRNAVKAGDREAAEIVAGLEGP